MMYVGFSTKRPRYMAENTEIVSADPILPEGVLPDELINIKGLKEYKALTVDQKRLVNKDVALRQRTAFMLRSEGRTFEEVGQALGISAGHAAMDVKNHVRKLQRVGILDPVAERFSQLTRIDHMLVKYFSMALDGDYDAANIYLALENRRSKLLGLDQPIKMKIDHKHKKDQQANKVEVTKALADIADRMEKAGKELPTHLRQVREMYRQQTETPIIVEGEVVKKE